MTRWHIWKEAARPKTLTVSLAPVLMGTALAYKAGFFSLSIFVATLLGALFIQIGTNYANDYFDYLKGADTTERLGPKRATQQGWVKPHEMRRAFILAFLAASLAGLYLIWQGGWPVLLIGMLSILAGILYTATPLSLAYLGIADIFVVIFFGPVAVAGTYYVQALQFSWLSVWAGLAIGLLSDALLVITSLRDAEQDKKAGKKTLAVRLGKRFAQYQYASLWIGACLIPLILFLSRQISSTALLASATLFAGIRPIRLIFSFQKPQELLQGLPQTGRGVLLYGFLFSVSNLF